MLGKVVKQTLFFVERNAHFHTKVKQVFLNRVLLDKRRQQLVPELWTHLPAQGSGAVGNKGFQAGVYVPAADKPGHLRIVFVICGKEVSTVAQHIGWLYGGSHAKPCFLSRTLCHFYTHGCRYL